MRPLVIGAVAIALFGLTAFGAVAYLTSDGSSRPPAAALEPVAAAPVPAPAAPPALPTGGAAGPFYQPPPAELPVEAPVARYQPPKESWEAITPAARASALGPVGADVGRDLLVVQDQLSTCFDAAVAAQSGRIAPTQTADPTSHQDLRETILVLELETGSGTVRIADAPIESHGTADDATIACAQQILRGRTIRSPSAKPGGRHRLMMQLHP